MNILIVDDEALARSRLRTLLGDCQDTVRTTVAEAANTGEALAQLTPTGGRAFDLVLLDIHMPGQDGLCLAHAVQALPHPPAVVFVTAHADHAVSAFELDAVDYLTKPVRRERLLQALTKARRSHRRDAPAVASATHSAASAADGETLVIQDRGRTERVPLTEVLYLKSEFKYLTVRTATRSHILDGSLAEFEERYPKHFVRVHRNALVARAAIRALEKYDDGEDAEGWALRLEGVPEPVVVSRRQLAAVREALKESSS